MQNVEEKTVDIDTSGPGAEIELPEEQTPESNIEVSNDTENNTDHDQLKTEIFCYFSFCTMGLSYKRIAPLFNTLIYGLI